MSLSDESISTKALLRVEELENGQNQSRTETERAAPISHNSRNGKREHSPSAVVGPASLALNAFLFQEGVERVVVGAFGQVCEHYGDDFACMEVISVTQQSSVEIHFFQLSPRGPVGFNQSSRHTPDLQKIHLDHSVSGYFVYQYATVR